MWVLAEHSVVSDTDDIACHCIKATLRHREGGSTQLTAARRVSVGGKKSTCTLEALSGEGQKRAKVAPTVW